MFDIITVLAYVENCGTFVKAKYKRIPILTVAIHFCGFIPVDPTSPESCKEGLLAAKAAILNGESFVAWPEGTRTKDGTLGLFNNGIFRVALETEMDITPIVFTSSQPVFNNLGALGIHEGKITFVADTQPEILTKHLSKITPQDVKDLREQTRSLLLTKINSETTPDWLSKKINTSPMASVLL
jgi:1-acyl-sn-glycerol-3-phosphate acyltransferase